MQMALPSPDERGKRTMAESLKHLCMSEKFADVKFVFGNGSTILHAHRTILSLRSPVFEAMLYGPLAGESSQEIKIEDTDIETFSDFLRFIYTDDTALEGGSVLKLMYLANKYNLDILEEKCSTFLESSITVDNVCTIHEHAGLYGHDELENRCFDFILDHNEEVLLSKNFLTISKEVLGTILVEDEITANEKLIFDAAVRWAEQRCKSTQKEATAANIREQLGVDFYSIRFPLIPMDIFAKEVCPSQLLTTEEENQLFRYLATVEDDPDPESSVETVGRFSTLPRKDKYIVVRLDDLEDTPLHKRRRLGTLYGIMDACLTIRPSQEVQLHSIVFRDPEFVSIIDFIGMSCEEEDEDQTEYRYDFQRNDTRVTFDEPIEFDGQSKVRFQLTNNFDVENYRQKTYFQNDEVNLKIYYNPLIIDEIVFLR